MPKEIAIIVHTWFPNNQALIDLISQHLPYSIKYLVLSKKDPHRAWEIDKEAKIKPIVVPGKSFSFFSRIVNFNFSISNFLSKINPNLIIIKGWGDPAYITAAHFALKRKIPLITWMCGRKRKLGLGDKLIRASSNLLARWVIKNSNFVFVYGSKAKKDALKLGARNKDIIIVKQSINEEHFDYKNYSFKEAEKIALRKKLGLDERPLFLCISQLIPRKGIKDLFQAFTLLKNKYNVQLLLIGKGPLKSYVQNYIKKYPRNCFWIPAVAYEKIPLYYLIADYFVFPTHFDAWGTVVNEAHCAKLPIICSDGAQSAADLIQHGYSGLVYKAGDIQTLVEFMEYALNHPVEMRKMAENGYNFIQSEWNQKESAKIWAKYIKIAVEENR